jgi:uncharacterized membrane protein
VAVGPCELLIVKFPGNRFHGEIAPALVDLARSGTITILDLVFVTKDGAGVVSTIEITDIDGDGVPDIVASSEINHAIAEDDVDGAAAVLEPNSSELLMLFEHTWAARVTQAMRDADGEVIHMERIPAAVVEEALAADRA